jgi:hypothetical protein
VPCLSTYPRACVPGYSLRAAGLGLSREASEKPRHIKKRELRPDPLVEPALMAQLDHFLNEDSLLLVVQAGE